MFKYAERVNGECLPLALARTPRHPDNLAMHRAEKLIHLTRGEKVMLDRDLAELYGVRPIALRQQEKRTGSSRCAAASFADDLDTAIWIPLGNLLIPAKAQGGCSSIPSA
jgi:hypothetical protein